MKTLFFIPYHTLVGICYLSGNIADDVLQHKESKMVTNLNGKQSTITIDFTLTRK